MDISLIQGTIASLKFAGDIAKSIFDLKITGEVQGKIVELQNTLMSAQNSVLSAYTEQASMVEEIRTLKEEMARIKKWEEEKKRYALVSPWRSFSTFALKKECSLSEPPHLICQKCYEDGRKSILNPKKERDNQRFHLYCPVCKSEIHNIQPALPSPKYAEEYSTGV